MSNTKNLANLAAALDDGTSGQVLQSTGSGGVQFADSSGSGVTVHANQAAMLTDAASADEGTLHYETNTNKLYVKQTSGFYLLASITNASPTIDSFSENTGGAGANNLTAGGTFTLTAGSNTVITINATEPDLETISYSATVTSGTATDVFSSPSFPVTNQSSNVFTLTPVTSGSGGTVTIRFDASDGTNVANVSHSFEIAFIITDSHYTSLLMATDGSAGNNQDDISDSSSNDHSITVNGDVYAGTVSPYRHGGYSLDIGSGSSYVYTSNHSDFAFGTGYFSVEAWINFSSFSNSGFTNTQNSTSTASSGQWYVVFISSTVIRMGGHGAANYTDATVAEMTVGDWHHVILKRDGNGFKVFVDGTEATSYSSTGTAVASQNFNSSSGTLAVGYSAGTGPALGKIADFRILKGGAASTSTPTERLTEITNTVLLTAHTNRIFDETGTHTLTPTGTVVVAHSGPYDYQGYSASTNGGSVYFDGSGDYLSAADSDDWHIGASSFTIEFWIYKANKGNYSTLIANRASGSDEWAVRLDIKTTTYVEGAVRLDWGSNYYYWTESAADIPVDQWTHIAITRSSTTATLYVNGVSKGSVTLSGDISNISGPLTIGSQDGTGEYYEGYLSDLRLVNGTVVYSGNFTPPTGPLTTTGGTYPSTTNVNTSITSGHTKLLLKGTDAHVIDKSQNYNLELVGTAAAVTNATNNSTISSTNAISLDGDSDYVKPNDVILPIVQDVDYTIEGWFYADTITGVHPIVSQYISGNGGRFSILVENSVLKFFEGGSPRQTISVNTGTWYHFLMCRSGTTHYAFMNGTLVGSSWTSSTNIVNTNTLIGHFATTTDYYFDGFLQDIRISIGKARETSDFTVPSAPLKG